MNFKYNELIELLEKAKEKSKEENPIIHIGIEHNGGTIYGGFDITVEESMFDRMQKDVFITSKAIIKN